MTAQAFRGPGRRHFLARGHRLQRREPAMGYASRLAALAKVDLWTLVHDMRIPVRGLAAGDAEAVAALADLRALDANDRVALARYTPRRSTGGGGYTLAGHSLPSQMVLTTSTRVCPHCIAEDLAAFDGRIEARPWQRVEWTLAPVRSCSLHGMALIEIRPTERLHIGFDFAKTVAEQVLPVLESLRAETVPAPDAAYAEWVVARLDGMTDPGNWLDDVALQAGVSFCEALGISILHPPQTRPSSLGPLALLQAIHKGFAVASRGAEALTATFDAMTDARPMRQRGSPGQEKTYGQVYRAMNLVGDDPDFAKFRTVLREHAFATLPLPRGKLVLGGRLAERRVHTLATAAKAYAHANHVMRRMLDADTPGTDGDGPPDTARLVLPVKALDALAERIGGYLNQKGVAAATGFTIDQVDVLVQMGWLPTLPEDLRPAGVHYRYLRSEVDALMERFFRDAEPVTAPEGRRMTVTKARIVTRTLNTEILSLIHDGQLAWVGQHGKGRRYGNLLVDADEVRAILRPPALSQGLTAVEAIQHLPGVQKSSVVRLAQAGLLNVIREYRPDCLRTVRLYSRPSIEAFRKGYVTAGEVAQVTGWPPLHAVRWLAKAGVPEVVDYATVKTKVYRRSDVLRHIPCVADPRPARRPRP